MRIGFLTSDLGHHHGWGHYTLSLILALRNAGVEVSVVAARNSQPIEGLPVTARLPILVPREPRFVLRTLLHIPSARRLLRDCDIIHAPAEPFAPLAAGVAGKRPLFITGHGSYVRFDQQRWPVRALFRQAYSRARVVCDSRYTERVLQRILPGAQTAVVTLGVDVQRYMILRAPAHTLPKPIPTVLSVGAVKPRKGTLDLVQAMAVVRQYVPDVQCVILGSLEMEPEYVERVRAAMNDLHLNDCVRLLGHVTEEALLGWYGAADVFVLPSINDGWKFEGYGLVYMEASAAGLPVIGTTDCGAEDAIDHGVTGLLVPQNNLAEGLPQAILSILTDPARAQQMGAAGREKARQQTWDHVARQMIALYEAALANKPHTSFRQDRYKDGAHDTPPPNSGEARRGL